MNFIRMLPLLHRLSGSGRHLDNLKGWIHHAVFIITCFILLVQPLPVFAQKPDKPDFEPPEVIVTGKETFWPDEKRTDDYTPGRELPPLGLEVALPPPLRYYPEPSLSGVPDAPTPERKQLNTVIVLSQGNYTTNFFDGAHSGNLPPWDYRVHIRENFTRGHRPNSEYWDVAADGEAGYSLEDWARVYLRTDNLVKRYEMPLAADADEAFIRAHRSRVAPGIAARIGDNMEIEFEPFFSYSTLITRDRSLLPPGSKDDDDMRTAYRYGTSGSLHVELPYNQRLTVGGEVWREQVDSEESVISYANVVGNFYAVDEINWLESFSTQIGIAFDTHDKFGEQVSPMFGFSWRPVESAELYGKVERRFTVRTFDELYIDPNYVEVNDELEPEKEWAYRLGFRGTFMKWLKVKTELFRRDIKDYIFYQEVIPGGNLDESDGLWQPQNLRNDIFIQGVEIKFDIQKWDYVQPFIAYRFSDAEDRDAAGLEVPFIPEHEVDMGLTFFIPDIGVEGELAGKFVSDQFSDRQGSSDFLLDEYWLWRAKISKTFGRHFSVFATVDNIFDVRYETRRGYYLPGTSFAIGGAARF